MHKMGRKYPRTLTDRVVELNILMIKIWVFLVRWDAGKKIQCEIERIVTDTGFWLIISLWKVTLSRAHLFSYSSSHPQWMIFSRLCMRSGLLWVRSGLLWMRSRRLWMRSGRLWNRSGWLWMRSGRVIRLSDCCQCQSGNSPGFNPSILRHGGICRAADKEVLNKVL